MVFVVPKSFLLYHQIPNILMGWMMGRIKSAISALGVKKLSKAPGMHAVGGVPGLYLCVNMNPCFAASWIYRYSFSGRRRDMGLGSYSDYSLEEARHQASKCRSQVLQGWMTSNNKKTPRKKRIASGSLFSTASKAIWMPMVMPGRTRSTGHNGTAR